MQPRNWLRWMLGLLALGIAVLVAWPSRHTHPTAVGLDTPQGSHEATRADEHTGLPQTGLVPSLPATSPSTVVRLGGPIDFAEFMAEATPCQRVCGTDPDCRLDAKQQPVCSLSCERDETCGEGAKCVDTLMVDGTLTKHCLVSNCSPSAGDTTCGPHASCQGRISDFKGTVYRCKPTGDRAAGELCTSRGDDKDSHLVLCQMGLSCADGMCTPSACSQDVDCPAGTKCHNTPTGKACVPECLQDEDCPNHGRCAPLPTGLLICLAADVPKTCLELGCPAGETCDRFNMAPPLGHCDKPCSATDAADVCGPTRVCSPEVGRCMERCDKQTPCPMGMLCDAKYHICTEDGTFEYNYVRALYRT